MLIFSRSNSIGTASGNVTLCTLLFSTQVLVSSLSVGDCSAHRLREHSLNLCAEQSPKDSDDTRCCVNTVVLLKMSIIVFETCRGM